MAGMPPEMKMLVAAAQKLEPDELATIATAVSTISEGDFSSIEPAAVGKIVKAYSLLPAEGQALVTKQLPPTAAPVVHALASLPEADAAILAEVMLPLAASLAGGGDAEAPAVRGQAHSIPLQLLCITMPLRTCVSCPRTCLRPPQPEGAAAASGLDALDAEAAINLSRVMSHMPAAAQCVSPESRRPVRI
eukprot:SAG11_NODE_640_length_8012_cov_14.412486_4_plen_191_part_00